jgi:DNA end-binding protein Ku
MPSRPIWRGHLRVALVSCPVALYTANRERGTLRFHLINPETGHRVRMITLDAETEQEVSRRDLVKGYEFKKDTYLILTDEDFESARIDSSSTLTVDKFVPAAAIDPIYYDTSYLLAPDGEVGKDVYLVLRQAIAESKRIALSRLVIARRERPVAIMALGRGLVAHTLHEAGDIVNIDDAFSEVPAAGADPEMVKLATQLIDRQTDKYAPSDMEDRYEARLRAVIEAKLKGEGIEPEPEEEPERGKVIDLASALRQSLRQGGKQTEEPPARPSRRPTAAKQAPAKRPAARKEPARRRA